MLTMEVLKIWTTLIYVRRNEVTFKNASIIRDNKVTIWDKGNNQFYALSLQSLNVLWYIFLNAPRGFMGSQRVGHDWATELNWTATIQVWPKSNPLWLYSGSEN